MALSTHPDYRASPPVIFGCFVGGFIFALTLAFIVWKRVRQGQWVVYPHTSQACPPGVDANQRPQLWDLHTELQPGMAANASWDEITVRCFLSLVSIVLTWGSLCLL